MHTVKIIIVYDGTNYSGWQLQPNGITIQSRIEEAIEKAFKKRSRVYAASRTDAGVHARGQTAHFKMNVKVPEEKICLALNAVLPGDIGVSHAEYVPDNFNARFDARAKRYKYYILSSREKDPFLERYSWRLPYKLDIPLMRKEARALIGEHDFKSFQAHDKKERTSVRKIYGLSISKHNDTVTIDIEANGFLYNMVRNIVGTLVDIGRGYLPPGSMKRILLAKERSQAGPTAPAKGLFLIKVKY